MTLDLKNALGPLLAAVNAWVDGGFILTLLHRHDIRVGIASSMYIRSRWSVSLALRLEVLCVLHLCYWRWSTKRLLEAMEPRMEEYSRAQPLARGQIWRQVWRVMEGDMGQVQVGAWSDSRELKIVARADVKQIRARGDGDFRAHHAYMNPSSRRSGAQEFSILVDSVDDGSLWRACVEIAEKMQNPAPYTAVTDAMRRHEVTLWKNGTYGAVRLARWLFQAEGIEVSWSAEDWSLLRGMGEGVRAGMQQCGLSTYEDAQRLCELISAASGETYALDSLASFLCLGSRPSSRGSNELKWPKRAGPVTIEADLEMEAAPPSVSQPLARPRVRWKARAVMGGSSSVATRSCDRFLCMSSLIMFLDMKSHLAMRRCRRSTCLAGWTPQPLARNEQLNRWVALLLHVDGAPAVELRRLGVGRGCLTRVLACAWDWLDVLEGAVLHRLWRDPFVGALVVVRMALKFEVSGDHLKSALKLYQVARIQWQVHALEPGVVEALLPLRWMDGGM